MLLLVASFFAVASCRSHTGITVDEAKQLVLQAAVVTDVSGEPPYTPIRTRAVRKFQAEILERHCVR